MNEGIVEGGEDVGNSENSFSLTNLGTKGDNGFFFLYLSFTGGHFHVCFSESLKRMTQNVESDVIEP